MPISHSQFLPAIPWAVQKQRFPLLFQVYLLTLVLKDQLLLQPMTRVWMHPT